MGAQRTLDRASLTDDSARAGLFELKLMGGFELRRADQVVDVQPMSQRLLAFLALNERPLPRAYVAGVLWPDTTEGKAAANLRTALWRLGPYGEIVSACLGHLSLDDQVWVDVRFVHRACRLPDDEDGGPSTRSELVRGELLPGFWDEWLVFERERLRQECIHVNERDYRAALQRGDAYTAVCAALAAVECDPLREASTALLIRAYLFDGDRVRAWRHYEWFAELLRRELGVAPAASTTSLLER